MKHWDKVIILAATMLAGNANAEIRFGVVNEAALSLMKTPH